MCLLSRLSKWLLPYGYLPRLNDPLLVLGVLEPAVLPLNCNLHRPTLTNYKSKAGRELLVTVEENWIGQRWLNCG